MTDKQMSSITNEDLEKKKQETMAHAQNVMHVLERFHGPFFASLPARMDAIHRENASVRSKRQKIRIMALDINDKVSPQTACRHQCNHCCHIPVSLTSHEAEAISKKIGRDYVKSPAIQFSPRQVLQGNDWSDHYDKNPKVGPCTFLSSSGSCSIYEHRPIMCITHHSLDKTDFFCSQEIPPDETVVPSVDTSFIHQHYASLDLNFIVADIREFFPIS